MHISSVVPTALLALVSASTLPKAQQQELQKKLDELQRQLQEMQQNYADQIEELRFQLESLEQNQAQQVPARAPAQSANAFNPRITVFGDFLGRLDDQPVFQDDDPAGERIDDRMFLRETELDFRAAVDPWADAVLIAAVESEAPGEYELGIEEGYLLLKKLPILDSAPAGLKLQVGRFRPEFGRFNRIHRHDLPQIDYPPSLREFLGPEGFSREGLSGQFFLPSPGASSTLEANLSVLDGGDVAFAPDVEASQPALLGKVKWFSDFSAGKSLDVGVSALTEGPDARLYALDATYSWKPYVAGEWRSFLVGGELFASDLDQTGLSDRPWGGYVWSQYQFDRGLYLGLRYDQHQELEDSAQDTRTYSAFLTYYTTEFLRFRFGLDHVDSDVEEKDGLNSLSAQLTWVFGSHPTEPYWVNR